MTIKNIRMRSATTFRFSIGAYYFSVFLICRIGVKAGARAYHPEIRRLRRNKHKRDARCI